LLCKENRRGLRRTESRAGCDLFYARPDLEKESACAKVFSKRRTVAELSATFFIALSTEKSNRLVGAQERIYERIDEIY
jgi:hypothetical protein